MAPLASRAYGDSVARRIAPNVVQLILARPGPMLQLASTTLTLILVFRWCGLKRCGLRARRSSGQATIPWFAERRLALGH